MEIAQEEKAALLEQAVINSPAQEIAKVYDDLGYVEMSAPALGLACRFRGLAVVEALVQRGASFSFPLTKETEEKYKCYIGQNYDNYRTNYALYLLKVFRGEMKGACCLKGMTMNKSLKRESGKPLPFLSDEERVKILHYLFEQKEKIAFCPEEMLFYAIYAKDTVIREELRRLGVKLSEMRIHIITDGGRSMDGYWYEYSTMTGKVADEDYLEIMQQLALELNGKLFHYTEKLFEITKKRFRDIEVFAYFLAHFKQEKMNKYKMIRGLIDEDALDAMSIIEKEGWLNVPKKRDEMIDYASENGKTEALAWLLDFKNRTADFVAEQEKAEKKLMRELNASLDSVTELKKLWSYKKQEDNTLGITNYKGKNMEVVVPQKIGRGIVTTIDVNAFRGSYVNAYLGTDTDALYQYYASRGSYVNAHLTWEQIHQHRKITKITLPETIRFICRRAFSDMFALEEINIPEGVKEIGEYAFSGCKALQSITIPSTVEKIDDYAFSECKSLKNITIHGNVKCIGESAFANCSQLEEVCISDGVREIGERAFKGCSSLKKLTIPGTLDKIEKWAFGYCTTLEEVCVCEGVREIGACAFKNCSNLKKITIPETVQCLMTETTSIDMTLEVFHGCPEATVYCPAGSVAESYCKEKGFRFENI